MQNWYDNINLNQKKLLWIVSFLAILFYGIGLIPTILLAYLHFGSKK